MSENTPPVAGTAATIGEDVRRYVLDVQEALRDLAPEDVDDLTAGMTADLTEMIAERGGTARDHLGTPERYAQDLRVAAGFPESPPAARNGGVVTGMRILADRARTGLAEVRAHNPVVDGIADFVVSLRPAWWLARGVFVAALLLLVIGASWGVPVLLVLAGLSAGVSVIVGRHTVAGSGGPGTAIARVLFDVGGVLGGCATLLVVTTMVLPPTAVASTGFAPSTPGALAGAANLYVYDELGERVETARIFDAEGNPVTLMDSEWQTQDERLDVHGAPQRNSYPSVTEEEPRPWAEGHYRADRDAPWIPPQTIAALALDAPAPTDVPTPTPTPTPNATSSPEATVSPTATANPTATATPATSPSPTDSPVEQDATG